jgi:hypothetical protein
MIQIKDVRLIILAPQGLGRDVPGQVAADRATFVEESDRRIRCAGSHSLLTTRGWSACRTHVRGDRLSSVTIQGLLLC